jgi:hypothetical protein
MGTFMRQEISLYLLFVPQKQVHFTLLAPFFLHFPIRRPCDPSINTPQDQLVDPIGASVHELV